jgi:hypothetical protein
MSNKYHIQDLSMAALRNDVEELRRLLAGPHRASINSSTSGYGRPLNNAAGRDEVHTGFLGVREGHSEL